MKIIKFAAIDIGSNAIRLLFTNVIEKDGESYLKKSSLIRVPIRLGADTFTNQFISPEKEEKMVNTMIAFRKLMDVHEIQAYRACATSAMREASNGYQLIERINKVANIKIDIISGKEEANIIFSNKFTSILDPNKHYLYVDVGGGSTEISLLTGGKAHFSCSFNVGTIRILENCVPPNEFIRIKECLLDICSSKDNIEIIGSGGNINKLFKYASPRNERYLTYHELKDIHSLFSSISYDDLMIKYNMNPDRADVIIPAATIFLSIMEWANSNVIQIPKIGISDGIINQLYQRYSASNILV
ncbi:exopolyphosphatase [Ancylomarina sp. 16SWW S1-10-2]|uniref:Ppx/GppA phosphatase family protein n=1 Tax=Ancylomarina sp. 16SWW S1-10-2 TaxID=2499681 RepID=UPI0012AD5A93|nr:exopolyphosphatase [Ancylomarina sp. 16SWW S1-10-2]MRT91793.1 exopolyphosphatase [Ancylomarina sp. 16SWW S1-10-2]